MADIHSEASELTKYLAFADDFVVYSVHEDRDTAVAILQSTLSRLGGWLENLCLKISLKKSKFLILDPPGKFTKCGGESLKLG